MSLHSTHCIIAFYIQRPAKKSRRSRHTMSSPTCRHCLGACEARPPLHLRQQGLLTYLYRNRLHRPPNQARLLCWRQRPPPPHSLVAPSRGAKNFIMIPPFLTWKPNKWPSPPPHRTPCSYFHLLLTLGCPIKVPNLTFEDNGRCISLATNDMPTGISKSKHIDIKYYCIRDLVMQGANSIT